MKKLIILFMLLLTFLSVSCFAENVPLDMSNYTDDELLSIIHFIEDELFRRGGINGVYVPAGEYLIGSDIPYGVYSIKFAEDSYDGFLEIFEGGTQFNNVVDRIEIGAYAGITEIGRIDLNGKSMIKLDLPCKFYTYTGLFN